MTQSIQRKNSLFWIRLYLVFYGVLFLYVWVRAPLDDLSISLGLAETIRRSLPLAGIGLWVIALPCTPKRFWMFYIVFGLSLLLLYIAFAGFSGLELSQARIGLLVGDWFVIVMAALPCLVLSGLHYVVVIRDNKQAILEDDGTSMISRLFRLAESETTERPFN